MVGEEIRTIAAENHLEKVTLSQNLQKTNEELQIQHQKNSEMVKENQMLIFE